MLLTLLKHRRYLISKALRSVPGHTLHTFNDSTWKFFSNKNSQSTTQQWRWPFIDILFSKVNRTHIYDVTFSDSNEVHPIGDILPAGYTVFENLIMPVPRNMEAYIIRKYWYMQDLCISNAWNHKAEKTPKIKSTRIPCRAFFGMYPFVYRYNNNGELPIEELRLGRKVLYRVQRTFKWGFPADVN